MQTRFGDYSLFDLETKIGVDNRKLLHVICSCGQVDYRQERYLLTGRSTSCKSCSAKKTAKSFPPPINRKGCEGLSGTHFQTIKFGAKRRNIPFDVTPQFLWKLYEEQGRKCAITDLNIVLENKIEKSNVAWSIVTASLDRKDNDLGYTRDNVWWVHKEVNRLKNNYSMDELLYWSKLIVGKHGNLEPSVSKDVEVDTKVQRLDGDESNK